MTSPFRYDRQELQIGNVSLHSIAKRFGTPTYVYSQDAMLEAFSELSSAAKKHGNTLICYALKANPHLAILSLFAQHGAGFDIVSGGELQRVLASTGNASKTVFSGVGKSVSEIQQALLAGILCFNVESISELERINDLAGILKKKAPVAIRVNPDVDAQTHPHIATGLRNSKFGIPHGQILSTYRHAKSLPHIDVIGMACHIGSQITSIAPFLAALDRLMLLTEALAAEGIELHQLDLGGGLGICYCDETPPSRSELLQKIFQRLEQHPRGKHYKILFEFGRTLVGNAGGLLTRVEYIKDNGNKRFAIVDAGMNDLLRPSLYNAWHPVLTMHEEETTPPPQDRDAAANQRNGEEAGTPLRNRTKAVYDVVGPICESSDVLAKDRALCLKEGDLLLIGASGAYGMSMGSNYNSRPKAAEVLVLGSSVRLIRPRESAESLFAGEVHI